MVSAFNTKFFCVEAKYTLVELGRTKQYPGKNFDIYVKRFHEKALDYYKVCIQGMSDEYRVFLENLSFSSFTKLMEV